MSLCTLQSCMDKSLWLSHWLFWRITITSAMFVPPIMYRVSCRKRSNAQTEMQFPCHFSLVATPMPNASLNSHSTSIPLYHLQSVLPTLLDRLAHTLVVLLAVVLVQVGCFDIGGRTSVGVVEKTMHCVSICSIHLLNRIQPTHLWILVRMAATS